MTHEACVSLLQIFGISLATLENMSDFSVGHDGTENESLKAGPETAAVHQHRQLGPKWSTFAEDKILRKLRRMKAFIRLVDLLVANSLAKIVVKSIVAIVKRIGESEVSEAVANSDSLTPFVILEAEKEDNVEPVV